ncbi:FadR/GntR family transcriptional regulator (plasmid) [Streptomyces sp. BI20]|uniref:FadR/GntR family transcriptional regulator n=1 Tax=Streptomyces sp. BI20 TaxID=3403460 RepID=UPI003C77D669
MPLRPAGRTGLVDQVIAQMEALIAGGEWPLGHRIPAEPELVDSLGVGRNTVREAVRALVHGGLLAPRRGDGTYVSATSDLAAALTRRVRRSPAEESFEVRAVLERDAARLAALRRTDAELAGLRALLAERRTTWEAGDTPGFLDADARFHRAVVLAAHNTVLADLHEHLAPEVRAGVAAIVDSEAADAVRHQFAGHEAIVDAIAAGDADAAERAASGHLAEALSALSRQALVTGAGVGTRAGEEA